MKLIYAVDKSSYNSASHLGVKKKVESHIQQFQKSGIMARLCEYEWKNGEPQIEIDSDTDVLYFRRISPSFKLIKRLHYLKTISTKLRVIMEIPTYPFVKQKEDKTLKKTINRIIGLSLLRFYVDRIVIIGEPIERLYHIPTICACNGINYDDVKIRKISACNNDSAAIHLICVSSCSKSHGYERVIDGLKNYYSGADDKEDVFLHLVGEGRCLEEYKTLARESNLIDDKIFFYGNKTGTDLDAIYDKSDIGLVCLGTYKTHITYSSALKAREYAAKGLPMVNDVCLDICNDKTKDYVLTVLSEPAPIDIQDIIDFYHKIYDGKHKEEVAEKIRETFYPYCDWKYVFQEVITYIKKENA